MLKKISNKAQMSAPFELLVAIIVMIFVIAAGSYALANLNENTCLGNKRQDFSNLISSLRDVVLGSDLAYRTIDFSTKACYDSKYEQTYLRPVDNDRDVCERYCGSGNSCILLQYSYIDEAKNQRKYPISPICTYLPPNLIFGSDMECGSQDSENETAIDPLNNTQNIAPGTYKIWKLSDAGAQSKICMVKTR
jgi:hypothetical protein